MTTTVYTAGYGGRHFEDMVAWLDALDADLFDIRFSPRSRNPVWSGTELAKRLGDRYVHVLAFGNRNYKGGPVDLMDYEAGKRQVLNWPRPVILLCVCTDPTHCHRTTVAARLREDGCTVEELDGHSIPDQRDCLQQLTIWSEND